MQNLGILRHLPNFLTCMNLFCGGLAIIFALEKNEFMVYSAYLIWLASIFDFFDGMTARVLKAYSSIGKKLDSLADMISFGIAPSVILYQIVKTSMGVKSFSYENFSTSQLLVLFSPFLIAVFSAMRLAKFNLDVRQSYSFIGFPTPPNAILISSLPLILYFNPKSLVLLNFLSTNNVFLGFVKNLQNIFTSLHFLVPMILFLSFLLVSEFPMFSLKFKNLKWSDNKMRYIFLIFAIFICLFLQTFGVFFAILTYILLAAIDFFFLKKPSAQDISDKE